MSTASMREGGRLDEREDGATGKGIGLEGRKDFLVKK